MSRPLRLEFPGALYHVTSRGDRKEPIYLNQSDRLKGIVVQREAYLLELTRYVVLNPVRAKLVEHPDDWRWSSYPCFIGIQTPPSWIDVNSTLMRFGAEPAEAREAYRQFVHAGIGATSPLLKTKHQLILGDDEYIQQVQKYGLRHSDHAIVRTQRRALALSLSEYALQYPIIEEAMAMAYHSTAYTMEEIGVYFGVSSKTVSRAVKKHKRG